MEQQGKLVPQLEMKGSSRLDSCVDLANIEVGNLVKRLVKQQHSTRLAVLAVQFSAVIYVGTAWQMANDFSQAHRLEQYLLEKSYDGRAVAQVLKECENLFGKSYLGQILSGRIPKVWLQSGHLVFCAKGVSTWRAWKKYLAKDAQVKKADAAGNRLSADALLNV